MPKLSSSRKRKAEVERPKSSNRRALSKLAQKHDNEIDEDLELSDDEAGEIANRSAALQNLEAEEEETADERRLRLARAYLDRVKASTRETEREGEEEDEDEESEEEAGKEVKEEKDGARDSLFASRLRQTILEESGKVIRKLSSRLVVPHKPHPFQLVGKRHPQSITSLTLSSDNKFGFAASKDGLINQFDIETNQSFKFMWPENSENTIKQGSKREKKKSSRCLLSLATSSDGRYLAAGGFDRLVHIWDVRTREHLQAFKGHRDAISSVVFRSGTNQLFSGSFDRSVKIWSIDDMAYIDSMFGHQSEIMAMDMLSAEKLLSCGKDRTCRIWKVSEEKQLVFNGHLSSIDCCRFLTLSDYVTGSEDGSVALWSAQRKKPVFQVRNAHKKKLDGKNINLNKTETNKIANGFLNANGTIPSGNGKIISEANIIRKLDFDTKGAVKENEEEAVEGEVEEEEEEEEPISFEMQLKLNSESERKNTSKEKDDKNQDHLSSENHVNTQSGDEFQDVVMRGKLDRESYLSWDRVIPPLAVQPGKTAFWIQSIAACRNSDLFATGAGNGSVKVWRCDFEKKRIDVLQELNAIGYVNALAFANSGEFLLAGLGQEPRLGRWGKIPEAKNGVILHKLQYT